MLLPLFGGYVSNSNISLNLGGLGDYELKVFQDEPATDYTSIWFDHSGSDIIFRDFAVDESSDWYFTNFNDPFNAATIGGGSYVYFNQFDQSFTVGLGVFYLGVNTGLVISGDRAEFGWVELLNTGTEIQMLSNAMEYGGSGVNIGIVPESSSYALCAGLICVMWVVLIRGQISAVN